VRLGSVCASRAGERAFAIANFPRESTSWFVGRSLQHLVKLEAVNRLYFGDNLKWLSDRKEFPDASVDLVYLDPPFNSNADYNVLFREPSGQVSQAQFHAFTDTWSWADGSAAKLPQTFTDDGLPSDDGTAPCRTSSRPEIERQPLSTLRSDRESLFEVNARSRFRPRAISE
jgi:hypothetical protein